MPGPAIRIATGGNSTAVLEKRNLVTLHQLQFRIRSLVLSLLELRVQAMYAENNRLLIRGSSLS